MMSEQNISLNSLTPSKLSICPFDDIKQQTQQWDKANGKAHLRDLFSPLPPFGMWSSEFQSNLTLNLALTEAPLRLRLQIICWICSDFTKSDVGSARHHSLRDLIVNNEILWHLSTTMRRMHPKGRRAAQRGFSKCLSDRVLGKCSPKAQCRSVSVTAHLASLSWWLTPRSDSPRSTDSDRLQIEPGWHSNRWHRHRPLPRRPNCRRIPSVFLVFVVHILRLFFLSLLLLLLSYLLSWAKLKLNC